MTVSARVLTSFDDPALAAETWSRLLAGGDTDTVFLTREWQRTWWSCFGRGDLLLILVERDGQPVALAPLFHEAGMLFLVGSGGSDYLDFIGDISDPQVLDAILNTAWSLVPGSLGFRFYHVPDRSGTGALLQRAAERLGLQCFDEGDLAAPTLHSSGGADAFGEAANKKSLVRHERRLRAMGELNIRHERTAAAITAQLPEFFDQHIRRWAVTEYPSLFHDERQRAFYIALANEAAAAGWLRFTRVELDGRPIAFHFGFCRGGSYLWYKPTFEIELARFSPGEVLLRQLLLAAQAEGARTFDFGLGDEPFKRRFTTHVERVRTWGLYPRN